ncbi:MAG TPA: hypothetical protein VL003_12270 [Pusillimonas sp.]|uniref:hypothetical protein n=1 Tax=Pusillimonas sp. TaxID=3040095 RepID=UPI002BCD9542|nr:hypothetical protein [Pusillimonas sp.]HUH88804.1 hypothetical protein [Pusillimonas sp.]
MKIPAKPLGLFAALTVVFISPAALAQTPDFSGTWHTTAQCPIGPVAFTVKVKGTEGTLAYDGYGPQKLHAANFPVKLTLIKPEMYVHFGGPDQGADFGSFQGVLLADGTVGQVRGLQVNGRYCDNFTLAKADASSGLAANSPKLDTQGLTNGPFFTTILQGRFETLNVPTDHLVFNSMFGSYLHAYARQCAANPSTRPKGFVEMTNLECVQEGITATYYRNGTYTESAPYCTKWQDVPTGFFADPEMWQVKQKLDAIFLRDEFKQMFALAKILQPVDPLDAAFKPTIQQILAAVRTAREDTEALVRMNGCNSPGLMRFQENLRLFALNKPFGIGPDGSLKPMVPIPAPGDTFKDPDYVALLEDLMKGEARKWQVNKYVLKSIANPSVSTRDSQNRPEKVTAGYQFGGMAGLQTGTMTVTFFQGYPECLYFSDRPDACRTPDKMVVSRYVHGGYAPGSAPPPLTEEQRLEQQKQREERARIRREARSVR